MKLLRTTALTAALIAIAVPSLTSSAQAWRLRGHGWRAAAVGAAVVGSAIAARNYYGYGYGTGYSYPAYGYGYVTVSATPPPIATVVMGPATATRRTAMALGTAMAPVTATRLTATGMAPGLSAAVSTPPLGVVGKKPD